MKQKRFVNSTTRTSVQLFEAIIEDGQHYLVMEYVEGGSLRELLDASAQLPLAHILQIALELCDALTQTHYRQIIHRDIKPANILLDQNGTPRLTDFGVARLAQAERVTQTGTAIGTLDYLSPEALEGEDVDTRTDIWSLGVLLYELLAQIRPFTGETLTEVVTAILTKPVPDLRNLRPDVPLALVDLIARMLKKTPDDRITSVRQIGAELEAILQGQAFSIDDSKVREGEDDHNFPGLELKSDQASRSQAPILQARHNLPTHTTPFLGRDSELRDLSQLLGESQARLITILGPGGMGKTRLALEAAAGQGANFLHGGFLRRLGPAGEPGSHTRRYRGGFGLSLS